MASSRTPAATAAPAPAHEEGLTLTPTHRAAAPTPAHEEQGLTLTPAQITASARAFAILAPASLGLIPFTGEKWQLDWLYLTNRRELFPPSPMMDYTTSPAGLPVLCPSCRAYFRLFTPPEGIAVPDARVYGPPRQCAFHRVYEYSVNHTSDECGMSVGPDDGD
ncbi:hypothetical protein B0T21DRAFT_407282 [Apiosordaria backusii]|uniref:Uncharacterized protein n=1 Tax=Apiosordaria backusii TaxID=314023 RepID=A0AA40K7H0_9PEZI|nr:hypothetical protein B0T21DRAFT_407282 [Apiosordaria backusii]